MSSGVTNKNFGYWFIWVLCGSVSWVVFVHLTVWPAALHGKNFTVGHYTQRFQPNYFRHAMLIGTIDLYHFYYFHWPWPWLEVSTKQNILASFSSILFNQSWWILIWCWSNLNWISWYYFLSNLVWWERLLSFTFWCQFGCPWPSFKVTVVWEIKNFNVQILRNFAVILDTIQSVTTTCWFVEAHVQFVFHK